MRKEIVPEKVTIDGIGHYVDPFLPDGDRTWCGEPVGPWNVKAWKGKCQACPDCMKKMEDANRV